MISLKLGLRRSVERKVRSALEFFNIDAMSKPYAVEGPGPHLRLTEILNQPNGFFIECGGYDGLFHSPTYFFEKLRGWRGILIEPLPKMYKECKKNRQESACYNYAVVSNSTTTKEVQVINCSIGSFIRGSQDEMAEDVKSIQRKIPEKEHVYIIKAKTLTDVLEEYEQQNGLPEKIDLLVLDIEGLELEALQGLDFTRYRPLYLLIEAHTKERFLQIEQFLKTKQYSFAEKISARDYLFH